MSEEIRLGINRDIYRLNFNKYTRKAFQSLPEIKTPQVLDIGCGTGESTLELARISNGKITAIDIDHESLDIFSKKIETKGLMHQIQLIKCSIHEMDFSNNSFDIIWMEGLQFIDFNSRCTLCYPLLKPGGFFVLHEGLKNTEEKIKVAVKHNLHLFSRFNLPDNAWWVDFYQYIEKRTKEQIKHFKHDSIKIKTLNKIIEEIEFAKSNPLEVRSLFLIFQKI